LVCCPDLVHETIDRLRLGIRIPRVLSSLTTILLPGR
jgi:hypothetical protein